MDEAQIYGELGGEGAGREIGEGEPFAVFVFGDPTTPLDQVAVHVLNQGDRAAETSRTQIEEIAD